MRTTTDNKKKMPQAADASQYNFPIFQIADPEEVLFALEKMFEGYSYQATWQDEDDHHTVCAVYFSMVKLLKTKQEA